MTDSSSQTNPDALPEPAKTSSVVVGVVPWDPRDNMLLAGLLLVGVVALLPNLGDRCLWQDEAECALVAKGVLRTGLPTAWDGRLLTTGLNGAELTDSFLWAWTPWAMHYVAALGMGIFGQTSFGARFLFALLGCGSIGLTYVVARRLIRDRWASCVAAVLLLTSVQYLLLMRQCRYYAIVPVAALVAILGLTDLPRRRGVVLLIVGMTVLFHANYVTCACVAVGLVAWALLCKHDRATLLRLGVAGIVVGALTLPWFFGMGIHHVLGASREVGYQRHSPGHEAFKMVFAMNQFVCPFVVCVGLAILAAVRGLRIRGAYRLVMCMVAPVMILVPVFLWSGPRYFVHLLPLGAIVVGAAMRELHLRSDVAGDLGAVVAGVTNLLPAFACAFFPVSVGTDRLDGDYATGPNVVRQAMLKSEWAGYVNELRQPFVGPNESITRFLNKNADPNDIIYATYGQLPIMFHTNLRCAGMLKEPSRARPGWDQLPDYLWDIDKADSMVVRPAWVPRDGGYKPIARRMQNRARRAGRRLVDQDLETTDTTWGNRPLLRYHIFQTPISNPRFSVRIIQTEQAGRRARTSPRP